MKAAYGTNTSYGAQIETPEQKALQQALGVSPDEEGGGGTTPAQQLQKPYAADNGMAQASAQQASAAQQGTTAADQFSATKTDQQANTGGSTGFTPAASPVTPDGQIRATTGEQYQAPAPAPAPAAAPPAPAAGAGWSWVNVNGSWVPSNHSMVTGGSIIPTTNATGTLPQAPVAGTSVYGPYPARPANTNWTADLSGIPAPYQGTQFSQQTLPNLSGLDAMQMQALQQAFAGTPLNTEAMKARLREDAAAMAAQAAQGVDQNVASRGTFGGGNQLAAKSDIQSQAISDMLSGYRDIDIAAADRKQADLLAALGASSDVAAGQFGRGLSAAQFSREGEQAQAAENLTANQQALANALARNQLTAQEATMNQANYGTDIDAFFKQKGYQTQADLTREGYAADMQRAKLGALISLLGLSQGAWDTENQLGYNYTALQQDALNRALY